MHSPTERENVDTVVSPTGQGAQGCWLLPVLYVPMLQGATVASGFQPQPGCVMQADAFWADVVAVIRHAPQGMLRADGPTPPGHQLFLGQAAQVAEGAGWLKKPGAQPAAQHMNGAQGVFGARGVHQEDGACVLSGRQHGPADEPACQRAGPAMQRPSAPARSPHVSLASW